MTVVVYNGATGGLGRHLGAALADRQLAGAALSSRLGDTAAITAELDQIAIEPGSAIALIQSAAFVPVREVSSDPETAYDINVTRTATTAAAFVEWAADHDHPASIVFVSSGHVYAPTEPGVRVSEDAPVRPMSVYAKTKLAGEERLRAVADGRGARLLVARVFGIIGPDQRPSYLLPGLIRRARENDLAAVPGLDHVRDYLDARDVARHLAILAAVGSAPDTVNVCSGEPTRIGDLLDEVLRVTHAGDADALAAARSSITAAPGRDSDVPWLVGDPTLLDKHGDGVIRSIDLTDTVAEVAS